MRYCWGKEDTRIDCLRDQRRLPRGESFGQGLERQVEVCQNHRENKTFFYSTLFTSNVSFGSVESWLREQGLRICQCLAPKVSLDSIFIFWLRWLGPREGKGLSQGCTAGDEKILKSESLDFWSNLAPTTIVHSPLFPFPTTIWPDQLPHPSQPDSR